MSDAKVKIQINVILLDDGRVAIQTSSKNEIANVGLLMKAVQVIQGGVKVDHQEPSPIIQPRFDA